MRHEELTESRAPLLPVISCHACPGACTRAGKRGGRGRQVGTSFLLFSLFTRLSLLVALARARARDRPPDGTPGNAHGQPVHARTCERRV